MAADERFLARWLRRKQEQSRKPSASAPQVSFAPQKENAATDDKTGIAAKHASESMSLPSIDLTGPQALRDILASGLPADATRTALRQAWLSDPAIRDFIGLSENSWDFTAPDGVPGFGLLSAEQVQQLLAQPIEESENGVGVPSDSAQVMPRQPESAAAAALPNTSPPGSPVHPITADNSAMQRERTESEDASIPRPRRHGSALPK